MLYESTLMAYWNEKRKFQCKYNGLTSHIKGFLGVCVIQEFNH